MTLSFYGSAPWLAAAGYFWLGWLHRRGADPARSPLASKMGQLGLLAVIALHGAALLPNWFAREGLQFGFATSISWTLWLAVLLLWIESWFQKLPPLARTAFPVAGVAALLPLAFSGPVIGGELHAGFRIHMLLAMLAYSTFTLAAACAVLMMIMERALHQTKKVSISQNGWWQGMPPLLSLDQMLMHVVLAGFALLTLTLVSGVVVSLEMGYGLMRIDHKTVFTMAAWFLGLTLLLGRRFWGWRGRVAARWTLAGYVTLIMAYVGTRFVLEVLLHRAG